MTKFEELEAIAKQHLNIPTLKTRNMDSDDFHEVAVWTVLNALERAYEAGRGQWLEEKAAREKTPDDGWPCSESKSGKCEYDDAYEDAEYCMHCNEPEDRTDVR